VISGIFSTNMTELISDGELAIRLMRDELGDYQVMAKRLSDPRVLEFYEVATMLCRSSRSSLSTHRAFVAKKTLPPV
jgi:hypothetical protein